MRILLISSAFSGLTQRFYTELDDAGYQVSVELHLGNEQRLQEAVDDFKPDLIICPYLTRKIPAAIYRSITCLIVHPGIRGDRGPSSLDWAIMDGVDEWGVTLLEADDEMDAGPIWASKNFRMRTATKSSLFNREVTQAAIDCLWEALAYVQAPHFKPQALDYNSPDVKGRLRPQMKQSDRRIDWQRHKTNDIVKRINAADGSPGVLDDIGGQAFYLYNARPERHLHGKPGDIIAVANHAICRATIDGALWIGHVKAKYPDGSGIKLPAALALQHLLTQPVRTWFGIVNKPLRHITIDYTRPGKQLPCQEIWYERQGDAAYLYFNCHNGGLSAEQCRLLLTVYRHLATSDAKAIVLMGGEDTWSNGIHLNQIEAAENPADESWRNINAIDDVILQIVNTVDKITISAVAGNAGAGGAILAIATDKVWARDGVVFNPHYKNMGDLFGSEYWTYLLPKRVGQTKANELTEQRLPISARRAWHLGMIDNVLDAQHDIFAAQVRHLVGTLLSDTAGLTEMLNDKARIRCRDEASKPLAAYRSFELAQMHANFYGNEAYHQARRAFVYKTPLNTTPDNICKHRKDQSSTLRGRPGSMVHCVWQDYYAIGDEELDNQHKDFFNLAQQMLSSRNQSELSGLLASLYQHVKEHFTEEEKLMKQAGYHHYDEHMKEHNLMLEKLIELSHKIRDNLWQDSDIETFIAKWSGHIIGADMAFNQHWKEMNQFCV